MKKSHDLRSTEMLGRALLLALSFCSALYLLFMTQQFGVYLNNSYFRIDQPELFWDDLHYDAIFVLLLSVAAAYTSLQFSLGARLVSKPVSTAKIIVGTGLVILFDLFILRPGIMVFAAAVSAPALNAINMGTTMSRSMFSFSGCVIPFLRAVLASACCCLLLRDNGSSPEKAKRATALRSVFAVLVVLYALFQCRTYNITQNGRNVIYVEAFSWVAYPLVILFGKVPLPRERRSRLQLSAICLEFFLLLLILVLSGSDAEPYEVQPVQFFFKVLGMQYLVLYLAAMLLLLAVAYIGWRGQPEETRILTSGAFFLLLFRWGHAVLALFVPALFGDQQDALPFIGSCAMLDVWCFGACAAGFFKGTDSSRALPERDEISQGAWPEESAADSGSRETAVL